MIAYRLSAIVLFLGLLSGAWAATLKQDNTIIEPTFEEEEKLVNFSYNPIDLEEVKRIEKIIWMQNEITHLWGLYLEEHKISVDEIRKKELKGLAWDLATSVDKYQRIPSNWKWWLPERRGTTLPEESDVHLLLATMAGFESKVDPTVEGKLGEVGILQCHTWCRKDYSKQEVKENPQLAIELSVQFLAESIDQCGIKLDSLSNKNLKDREWAKPVALYGAGMVAIENGRCIDKSFARWRVNVMKKLRKKIRNKPGGGDGKTIHKRTPTAQTARGLPDNPA